MAAKQRGTHRSSDLSLSPWIQGGDNRVTGRRGKARGAGGRKKRCGGEKGADRLRARHARLWSCMAWPSLAALPSQSICWSPHCPASPTVQTRHMPDLCRTDWVPGLKIQDKSYTTDVWGWREGKIRAIRSRGQLKECYLKKKILRNRANKVYKVTYIKQPDYRGLTSE